MTSEPLARVIKAQVRYHLRPHQWVPHTPLSLDLTEGHTTLVVGPSGCGKSTLCLTLNGLVPHSIPSDYAGSILVDGMEVADTDIAPLACRVALVMQDPDCQIVRSTVWDEVCYALENMALPLDEINTRAAQALHLMGIADLAERNPWELSGGQRQRVVLAGALAQRPRVLVLDEPTANLDPASSARLHRSIADLADSGMTILVVEHELDTLAHHADHVLALDKDGAVIASGTPREVFVDAADALEKAGIGVPTSVRLGRRLHLTPVPLNREEALTCLAAKVPRAVSRRDEDEAAGASRDADVEQSTRKDEAAHGSVARVRPVLEVEGLGVRKGGRQILGDMSFLADAGEMTALIGANGSGKTTLLRALVGLQKPSHGRVLVGGKSRLKHLRSVCTLVTQNPEHQFVTGSVRNELAHAMRVARIDRHLVEETTQRLLREHGLEELADHNPFTLSGGQKRRLSVAAALTVPRDLLLLDEPTFGQDAAHATTLMEQMRSHASKGTTIIFATHDLALAADYADRCLVLTEGKLLADGPTRLILSDLPLLAEAGLDPTPLSALVSAAHEAGIHLPDWLTWKDVSPMDGIAQ